VALFGLNNRKGIYSLSLPPSGGSVPFIFFRGLLKPFLEFSYSFGAPFPWARKFPLCFQFTYLGFREFGFFGGSPFVIGSTGAHKKVFGKFPGGLLGDGSIIFLSGTTLFLKRCSIFSPKKRVWAIFLGGPL